MGSREAVVRGRVGYLGPAGTFTHEAVDRLAAVRGMEAKAYSSVADVFHGLETGEVEAGVVPIENSIEGAVTATLDGLAFGRRGIRIAAEVLLPIHFDVFMPASLSGSRLKEVMSHPHALAQCRRFIGRRRLGTRVTLSTAEACERLRSSPQAGVGAIASRKAGDLYGLVAVARGIEDVKDAVTRFVYLARAPRQALEGAPTGADKTSLVLTPKRDLPGSLVELLQEFSSRGINLSRIESRPLKTRLGRYCFFIDASGHIKDATLGEAVRALSRKEVEVKFLGSYADVSAGAVVRGKGGVGRRRIRAIRSVGVIGLGLIGGSMARALKGLDGIEVVGYDRDARAERMASAAGIRCVPISGMGACELVVVAVPIERCEGVFRDLSAHLERRPIVTDVSSVKGPILESARRHLGSRAHFIGGHPMAGSERSGFASSRADLFRGTPWVMTVTEDMPGEAYLRLMELLSRLEMRVAPLSAESHDAAVSMISHLPHVLSYTLTAGTSARAGRAVLEDLAAGSFRDLVRVSGASPDSWARICEMNAACVATALEAYVGDLTKALDYLRRGEIERLRRIFARGHKEHRRFMAPTYQRRRIKWPERTAAVKIKELLESMSRRGGRIEALEIGGGVVRVVAAERKG
ncbi:MAG: hypothetical protein A3G34_04645 [Candidatus Lindowbacteria bacterium RIFCSPLOWO2_12_FULL_62_27]|nr:MAG: hypothetical protein A3I06_04410 [Candidatus Lindowbacteria bacterium RIFCSPLOWO2_02_FULL_62_12]OGH57447.1 MAG: hypothetical protein A3G34_04645 [Candidatus Lindowbacteria bacterium RIFCSPLOWO2_12_FULL_62_27]